MKTQTSISLEPDLLQQLHHLLGANGHDSISELIEDLLRSFVAARSCATSDQQDLELINQNADRLNEEANEVLSYQIGL
jgi:metal-responsive CopG/Arc/MetJ family transcriptional regulator